MKKIKKMIRNETGLAEAARLEYYGFRNDIMCKELVSPVNREPCGDKRAVPKVQLRVKKTNFIMSGGYIDQSSNSD